MKKLLFLILLCSLTVSCKNQYAIEREKQEKAFKHQRDSLAETDEQLSFMNIKIGGSVNMIDSALAQNKIQIDSCNNGIYVGSVTVPIVDDKEFFNSNANLRISTFDNKVASIELYFISKNPAYTIRTFDFFIETFCERYYDQHKEKLLSIMSSDFDSYSWIFKNQELSVDKKTHKEVGVGLLYNSNSHKNEYGTKELDILDGISVEYKHTQLYEKLMNSIKSKNSNTNKDQNTKQKEDELKRKQAEEIKTDYQKNI